MSSQQQTPTPPNAPTGCELAEVTGYAPMVGDQIRKAERICEVTMMSPGHVICLINGLEYTMKNGDFVHLAKKTLANGATLYRLCHNG